MAAGGTLPLGHWMALVVLGAAALCIWAVARRRPKQAAPDKATPMAARREAEARLKPAIERALKGIETLARGHAAIVLVTWVGAIGVSPVHLAFWIFTATDAERDRLASDRSLEVRLRAIVRTSGYPKAAVPRVGFAFGSKETVDRDFEGNYWRAMK